MKHDIPMGYLFLMVPRRSDKQFPKKPRESTRKKMNAARALARYGVGLEARAVRKVSNGLDESGLENRSVRNSRFDI